MRPSHLAATIRETLRARGLVLYKNRNPASVARWEIYQESDEQRLRPLARFLSLEQVSAAYPRVPKPQPDRRSILYNLVEANPGLTTGELSLKFGAEVYFLLKQLLAEGTVRREDGTTSTGHRTTVWYAVDWRW